MAIVIEEEKNNLDLFRLAGWAAIIVVLVVAAYYIFFASPELVIISPPASVQSLPPVTEFTLQPDAVLASPAFQLLKPPSFPLPTPQGPAAVSRPNPFVAP